MLGAWPELLKPGAASPPEIKNAAGVSAGGVPVVRQAADQSSPAAGEVRMPPEPPPRMRLISFMNMR